MNSVKHKGSLGMAQGTTRRGLASVIALSVAVSTLSCTAAVKQAAESAAPAAVEGAVEEAKDPTTRDAVAEILADEDIRASTAELSSAVAQGVVRGVETDVAVEQMQRITDAVVARVGAALAQSLERDIAPRMSAVAGRVIDDSIDRVLNEQTEARLQAAVAALTRATLAGANEGLAQVSLDEEDRLSTPAAQLTRNAWYSLGYHGAGGFEQAVRDAQKQQEAGGENNSLLATLGTMMGWVRLLPVVLLGGGALLLVGLTGALVWALVALRRQNRWLQERAAASSRLTEAMKSGYDADWFDQLAERVSRAAQDNETLSRKKSGAKA